MAFKAVSSVCSNKRSFGSGTSRYQASLYIFHSFFWISNYFQIKFERDKVQWVVLATLQFKSWSGSCNEIWILCPFSKAAEKTRPCFALEYWAMILDFVSAVSVQCSAVQRKILFLCFDLHFAPSQASSSQNSNVDNFYPDCHNPLKILVKILRLYSCGFKLFYIKGQQISKGNCGVFNSPEKRTKFYSTWIIIFIFLILSIYL